ncbi:MAG: prenyltransferase/squalene oxidase repeat-containing protein [Promethearchaeota archaeon]
MKKKNRVIAFFSLFLVCFLIMTPIVLGATRGTYLLNYVSSQQNGNNGFGDSHESTARALEILDYFNALERVNTSATQQYLRSEIVKMFDNNAINLYDLYYLLKSIDILNSTTTEVSTGLKEKIKLYLEDLNQTGGGFSPTNATESSSTMISTYFAIETYSILLDDAFQVMEIHKTWIKNCRDPITGGYQGNITASIPSLINTYCAVSIMQRAGAIGELTDIIKTVSYCNSFLVSMEADQTNFGGYLPDLTADNALISSTYYSIQVIYMLSSNAPLKENTINWIYNRQNFLDGGFTDIIYESVQGYSSIASSYFALKSLVLLGASLDIEIWMVEFNYIILIVIFIILAIIIGIAIFLWRRRKL